MPTVTSSTSDRTSTSSPFKTFIIDFLYFGLKQANASAFAGFILALLIITHFYYPLTSLHRYDFLFIAAVLAQIFLIAFKLEHPREILVIILFHIIATAMELFKTHPAINSWCYPEPAAIKILNVPLFTGFMYSAVGSYLARVWRIFNFHFSSFPSPKLTLPLATLIYINFFTHHYTLDLRYPLLLASLLIFGRITIFFKPNKTHRHMPLILGIALVSLFIYFAENIGTYTKTWIYPSQSESWSIVPFSKLIAWFLLLQISFILIAVINKAHRNAAPPSGAS